MTYFNENFSVFCFRGYFSVSFKDIWVQFDSGCSFSKPKEIVGKIYLHFLILDLQRDLWPKKFKQLVILRLMCNFQCLIPWVSSLYIQRSPFDLDLILSNVCISASNEPFLIIFDMFMLCMSCFYVTRSLNNQTNHYNKIGNGLQTIVCLTIVLEFMKCMV